MKNIFKLGGIIATLILVYSCNSNYRSFQTIQALPIEDTLHSKSVSLEKNLLATRHIKNVNDEYLVIVDRNKEGIFNVFNLPGLSYLYSWGRMGRGPNEFSLASFQTINVQDDRVEVYFPGLREVKLYFVTDTAFVADQTFSLSYTGQQMPLNGLRRVNDSLYIAVYGMTLNTPTEFVALAPGEKDSLFTVGKYPKSNLEGVDRLREYNKITAAKPDGTRFAAFYLYHHRFKIYNDKGTLLSEVEINASSSEDTTKNKDKIIYHGSLYATNDYIYVLEPNATRNEIFGDSQAFRPTIGVWDWDGNPVHRFRLDKPFFLFTVSKKYNKLYGISVYEKNKIYEYDLANVL